MFYPILLFGLVVKTISQEIVTDYPTLPSMWFAETIEPGAPGGGKGIESYMFVDKPTEDNPSAMWSNYTDCQRLIYVPNSYNAKRYLLGCDAVNCCWEDQDSNQVEFQIPNVQYSNPTKKVDVSWRNANVTNFGQIIEADEWSWSWTVKDKLSQDWRAYTLPCEECVNGIQLIQWQSRAMGSEWFPVEFKNYRGIDPNTDEGEQFKEEFYVPEICQKNNLLKCPSGLHDKYFDDNKCCENCPEGTDKYYSIPLFQHNRCGESCIDPNDYNKYHLFEPKLTKADSNTPCLDKGYTYYTSEQHGFGPVKISVDLFEKTNNIKYNYSPVETLNLSMYSGRWYQVYKNKFDMTFQGQGTCAVADYSLTSTNVSVLNSQFNKNGHVEQIEGYAFYKEGNSGGELSVVLEGVPTEMPYWVVELGPSIDNQYQYSIVSDDKQISLFVLARDVELFYQEYDSQVIKSLDNMGFTKNFNKPITMSQDNCNYNEFDNKYKLESTDCGVCGTSYQACCIGFAIDGYPCDCHLQEGGTGTAGSNCGDCGTGFAACCIGYSADGYPCQCDVI